MSINERMKDMRIGVDIGGTNLVAGLMDAQFQIVDK